MYCSLSYLLKTSLHLLSHLRWDSDNFLQRAESLDREMKKKGKVAHILYSFIILVQPYGCRIERRVGKWTGYKYSLAEQAIIFQIMTSEQKDQTKYFSQILKRAWLEGWMFSWLRRLKIELAGRSRRLGWKDKIGSYGGWCMHGRKGSNRVEVVVNYFQVNLEWNDLAIICIISDA